RSECDRRPPRVRGERRGASGGVPMRPRSGGGGVTPAQNLVGSLGLAKVIAGKGEPMAQNKQEITSGIVEPVQDRSVLSTRQLLEAAGALIAERGYENTSIAAIGERAGYSRGLVTARFGTKQNLLNVLLDRITFDWIDVHVA